MKKIMTIIIIMMIIGKTNCNAEIFYSDYYLKEANISEYYPESELLKREETYLYNNYFYTRINEAYYALGENPTEAPYLDQDDFLYYKTYTKNYHAQCTGPYASFSVIDGAKGRYLKFRSFLNNNSSVKLIKIYDQDIVIDYMIYETNYTFGEYLTNQVVFVIDLKQEYLLENLKIQIDIDSEDEAIFSFAIDSFRVYDHYAFSDYNFFNNILRSAKEESMIIDFYSRTNFIKLVTDSNLVEKNRISNTMYLNYFIEHNYQYKYYDLMPVKTNNYTTTPILEHYLDLEDYQILYTYYQRDKIEIIDEVNDLKDGLIITTTVPIQEINLESDLDYFKNGDYLVNFTIDDTNFSKNIKVNIAENVKLPKKRKSPKKKPVQKKQKIPNEIESITEEITEVTTEEIIKKDNWDKYRVFMGLFILFILFTFKRKKKN